MNLLPALTIALTTFKGFARDRIFYGVLVFAILFIGFSFLIATLTFVEDRKILLDFGFTAISLSGVIVAIFLGTTAIAKEIENRTIYSVLSKPLSRSQYLAGKLLGCSIVLFVTHLLLSITLLGVLLLWGEGFPPGLFACFFLMTVESLIVLSVASAFSVYSSAFLSGSIAFAIFLVGRSSGSLKALAEKGQTPLLRWIAKVSYWVFPNLERYNIRDMVAYGKAYPQEMLFIGSLYGMLYILFAFFISAGIFSKRDLP